MSTTLLFHPAPGTVYGFPHAQRLVRVRSAYQRIEVWNTPQLGRLFTLDGRPMTAVGDEFIYHECLTHPAALAHPAPAQALILGGGDGGTARQLLKYAQIQRIVIAELDMEVVNIARQFLGDVHQHAFDNPRVELVIGDAARYVDTIDEYFDLIIFDLTPPDSPAASLYTQAFYMRLKRLLKPHSIIAMHLGSPLFHSERITILLENLRAHFALVAPLATYVPLYNSPWLMAIASDATDATALTVHNIEQRLTDQHIGGLRYYNAQRHPALFALPHLLRDTFTPFPRA